MTLAQPDVALVKAYFRIRRLRQRFNRTQAQLIRAHAAHDALVARHPGRRIAVTKVTGEAPARSMGDFLAKRRKRTRRPIPGQLEIAL